MAGRKRREDVRLVEPVSLLDLSLGDVLLGLTETGEGRPGPAPADPAPTEEGPVLRLRMPGGRVERELLLGGFRRRDKAGGLTAPRIVTRREGKALACELYRIEEGGALYAGALKAAGAWAFVEAAPDAEFRYRNAPLRRTTAEELAAAVEPGRVYDYDLLGAEERVAPPAGVGEVAAEEGPATPGRRAADDVLDPLLAREPEGQAELALEVVGCSRPARRQGAALRAHGFLL